MIKTDKEYKSARQALERIERSLIELHKELYEKSPERYFIMADPYLDYIKKLRHDIDAYSGLSLAEEKSVPLWIRITGPNVSSSNISSTLLFKFLENFKMGVQRIADYSIESTVLKKGRPKKEISNLCDFNVKILPGSLRLGLSFPFPIGQKTLENDTIENPVENAVKKFLKGASWAVGLDKNNIEDIFPDEKERRLILNQIDKLTPAKESDYSTVEFKGKFADSKETIILTDKANERIQKAIKIAIPPEKTIEEGVIREMDLDRLCFDLRERPNNKKDLHCRYDKSLYDDARECFDKKVKIIGILIKDKYKKPRYLKVENIELISDK